VRVVAAFVPVDEENTLIYLRFYQNFMRTPLLGQLVTWLAMPFNVIVLRQDKRVVITQQPRKTALKMGEHLVQGDRPIVEYRRRREELIEAAEESAHGEAIWLLVRRFHQSQPNRPGMGRRVVASPSGAGWPACGR